MTSIDLLSLLSLGWSNSNLSNQTRSAVASPWRGKMCGRIYYSGMHYRRILKKAIFQEIRRGGFD